MGLPATPTDLNPHPSPELTPPRLLPRSPSREQSFHFDGIDAPPTPSLLRGFSAPVKLALERSDAELAFLAANDLDEFNRWDASQTLASRVLLAAAATLQKGGTPELPSSFVDAFRATLQASSLDMSLKAEALAPSVERGSCPPPRTPPRPLI